MKKLSLIALLAVFSISSFANPVHCKKCTKKCTTECKSKCPDIMKCNADKAKK
ncbi:MAG: hypothetical protein K0S09_2156 [Sphingobacteriaceae bacterium]|nr:hypothetical protein [Sphingobacteriaceae bacterium]